MSLFTRYNTTVPDDDMLRPILEVAQELGLEPEPSGNLWWACCCPVHGDDVPSLRINADAGYFLCFGCDSGGGSAHLYKLITGCTMEQAIRATVRADADVLDTLEERGSATTSSDQQSIVALQIMLAQRVLNDDDPPIEEWCAAMAEAKDDAELLAKLREIR